MIKVSQFDIISDDKSIDTVEWEMNKDCIIEVDTREIDTRCLTKSSQWVGWTVKLSCSKRPSESLINEVDIDMIGNS